MNYLLDTIGVMIVDDYQPTRVGLRARLKNAADIVVVAEAVNGYDALVEFDRAYDQIHVVLMDIVMPGIDGIQATCEIMSRSIHPAVIILSSYSEGPRILQALHAGAVGYILKDQVDFEKLEVLIRSVVAGQSVLSQSVLRLLRRRWAGERGVDPITLREFGEGYGLSEAEQSVLELLLGEETELSRRQIAEKINISVDTVKKRICGIYTKVNIHSRMELLKVYYSMILGQ